MSEAILIGTRGWQHDEWVGGLYPPELPEDWRFCYYSNNLRSVLVPGEAWSTADHAVLEGWVEDSDPQFRFVLELAPTLLRPVSRSEVATPARVFLDRIQPIRARTAGLLVRPAAAIPADWLDALVSELAYELPVCVDIAAAQRTDDLLDVVSLRGCGLCWRADNEPAPRPGGRCLVALSAAGAPRVLRQTIERLVQWRGEHACAGLFFDPPAQADRAAREARIIAELMGV